MSNPLAKAERSHAKDVRQGIVEQRERRQRLRRRADKPYRLMRLRPQLGPWKQEWHCLGRYKTLAEAERVLTKQMRSYAGLRGEWRIDGPVEHNEPARGD